MGTVNFISDPKEVHQYILAQGGELAFDIGANSGLLANLMADHFKKIIAVEPCPSSYNVLSYTPRRKIITPLNMAISDHVGSVTLGVKEATKKWGEFFTGDSLDFWGPDLDKVTVPCTTLDTLAAEYGIPNFVKIDTEGHEWYIVLGGEEVFRSKPHFCIEIHDNKWGELIQECFDGINLPWQIIRGGYPKGNPASFYEQHYWMVG